MRPRGLGRENRLRRSFSVRMLRLRKLAKSQRHPAVRRELTRLRRPAPKPPLPTKVLPTAAGLAPLYRIRHARLSTPALATARGPQANPQRRNWRRVQRWWSKAGVNSRRLAACARSRGCSSKAPALVRRSAVSRFSFWTWHPILDLLLMVDIVDAFVAWLQREKLAEQAEWRRIAHFLSAHATTVRLAPFSLPYTVGFGDASSRLAQLTLTTDGGPGNFVAWFQKWDTEHSWSGFVYATANVELQRQEVVSSDDPYPVTYYLAGELRVSTSSKPQPNWKEEGPSLIAGPADDRNYRTAGKPAPVSDPKYNVSVGISSLKVRYTYPNPILSPFDFILAKSNSLIGAIVGFLSKYDERIFRDMDVRVEIIPDVAHLNLLAEVDFYYPLYGPAIKWCLQALFNANDLLAKHAPEQGDGRLPNPPQKYNEGFYRRLNILRLLSAAPGPKSGSFHQIALQMREILRDENPRHLLPTRDKDLDGITIQYLQDAAMDIHADVQRAYAACGKSPSNLEFNYEGPPA
jgi:hypothetical protein